MRKAILAAFLASGALVGSAGAQVIELEACLSGAFEAPPIASFATGMCDLTYNRTTGMLTYDLNVSGLTGTAAHIHIGAVGVPGGIVIPFVGGPTNWNGAAGPLTAGQVNDMLHERWYVNVHSVAHPGGEIRGQVRIRQHLRSRPNGPEETPANASTATAIGELMINLPAGTLTYNVVATGLVGTAAHIHDGAPGVPGPIAIPLVGGPTVWSGTTGALTDAQILNLLDGQTYVNIHTAAFPGGEIRGQVGPGGLNGSSTTISLATGGKQHIELDAGAANAFQFYWLLGTITGTAPGLDVGNGLNLPLNIDNYFLFTFLNPNLLPTHSLNFLDANGRSESDWAIPPGLDPALAGVVYHHAYMLLDLTTVLGTFTSNPLILTLVP